MSLKVIHWFMRFVGAKPNGTPKTWNIDVEAVRNIGWVVTVVTSVLVYLTALASTPFQLRALNTQFDAVKTEQVKQHAAIEKVLTEQDKRLAITEAATVSTNKAILSMESKIDMLLQQGLNNADRRVR